MDQPLKSPPSYAIASVDHALRLAAMLQLEGSLSVAEAADRIGVARSTAHRLLRMLVYRDFAVQDEQRAYHAGPVLQLAQHSGSHTARLRAVALPHMRRLVDLVGETSNLTIRTGATARFIASLECDQALRVGNREGMVFPAYRVTGGLLLLADLVEEDVAALRAEDSEEDAGDWPAPDRLRADLARIRRSGFALNQGRSERGVVAIGVPVRDPEGRAVAGLSISIPSVRYDKQRLPHFVAALHKAAGAIEAGLR